VFDCFNIFILSTLAGSRASARRQTTLTVVFVIFPSPSEHRQIRQRLQPLTPCPFHPINHHRAQLKCDGTRSETRFRLSAKWTSPFKSAGASVQSTAGSRSVRISGSNAGYTMFRGSVKSTGYPLHSPVSSSLPLPCVTVCHHISTGVYQSTEQNVNNEQ